VTKKEWSRPECTKIALVPEEAVLTGCKVDGTAGPDLRGLNCRAGQAPCVLQTS